MSSLAAWIIW